VRGEPWLNEVVLMLKIGVPDIPTGRSDICTVLVTAEDKSSFNIFMIAGVGKLPSIVSNRSC
jgi:hypothetical protein